MPKVSGLRATLAVQHALNEVGLKRSSNLNGAETKGWMAMQYHRAAGFGVKPIKEGSPDLDWSVVISGRPHMRYEENERWVNDEVETSKDPVNPEVLYPKIKAVFESLGMQVKKVEKTGHQTMWDDDVNYNVHTDHPAWLEGYKLGNSAPFLTGPRLLCARIVETLHSKMKSFQPLPMYQLADKVDHNSWNSPKPLLPNSFGLTREALISLGENVESIAKHTPALANAISFDGDVLVLKGRFDHRIKPVTITNHWGDAVRVYPWPYMNISVEPKYTSEIPMLINGEMTTPDFLTLDSQYDGEGPWSVQPPTSEMKP